MKYDYHFNNETISIDIPDSDYDVLIEMDRLEYNANHKETRRHVSLEACDKNDNQLPSKTNLEATCIQQMEIDALRRGMRTILLKHLKGHSAFRTDAEAEKHRDKYAEIRRNHKESAALEVQHEEG